MLRSKVKNKANRTKSDADIVAYKKKRIMCSFEPQIKIQLL